MAVEAYVGNDAEYAMRREWKRRVEAILLPLHFKVGLVWPVGGEVCLIWYWGKGETSFAAGMTPEAAADRAIEQVFGGL